MARLTAGNVVVGEQRRTVKKRSKTMNDYMAELDLRSVTATCNSIPYSYKLG